MCNPPMVNKINRRYPYNVTMQPVQYVDTEDTNNVIFNNRQTVLIITPMYDITEFTPMVFDTDDEFFFYNIEPKNFVDSCIAAFVGILCAIIVNVTISTVVQCCFRRS